MEDEHDQLIGRLNNLEKVTVEDEKIDETDPNEEFLEELQQMDIDDFFRKQEEEIFRRRTAVGNGGEGGGRGYINN